MYHYTDSGLDNVFLANGFTEKKIGDDVYVSIQDIDGLHKAIGLNIVNNSPRLTAREIRFLRVELDMAQTHLAHLFDVSESTVRNWESGRVEISGAADRLLRVLYREHVEVDGEIREMVERISALNRSSYHTQMKFEASSSGWKMAA